MKKNLEEYSHTYDGKEHMIERPAEDREKMFFIVKDEHMEWFIAGIINRHYFQRVTDTIHDYETVSLVWSDLVSIDDPDLWSQITKDHLLN